MTHMLFRLIAIFSIFLLCSESFALKAKGASPAKTRRISSAEPDILDLVRAEGDPGFHEYVKERARYEKKRQQGIEELKKERAAWARQQEEQRLSYIKWRDKQVPPDQSRGFKTHLKETEAWEKRHSQQRDIYANQQYKVRRKLEYAKFERLNRAFPHVDSIQNVERLPASESSKK